MTITICGYSDDLIEVEGDISEEFGPEFDSPETLVAVSTGDVLRIQYSHTGVWRISPVIATDRLSIAQASEGDEENYSDVATIQGDVRWVVFGSAVVVAP